MVWNWVRATPGQASHAPLPLDGVHRVRRRPAQGWRGRPCRAQCSQPLSTAEAANRKCCSHFRMIGARRRSDGAPHPPPIRHGVRADATCPGVTAARAGAEGMRNGAHGRAPRPGAHRRRSARRWIRPRDERGAWFASFSGSDRSRRHKGSSIPAANPFSGCRTARDPVIGPYPEELMGPSAELKKEAIPYPYPQSPRRRAPCPLAKRSLPSAWMCAVIEYSNVSPQPPSRPHAGLQL